jgi:hypothetical protein
VMTKRSSTPSTPTQVPKGGLEVRRDTALVCGLKGPHPPAQRQNRLPCVLCLRRLLCGQRLRQHRS